MQKFLRDMLPSYFIIKKVDSWLYYIEDINCYVLLCSYTPPQNVLSVSLYQGKCSSCDSKMWSHDISTMKELFDAKSIPEMFCSNCEEMIIPIKKDVYE